jgi:streptomycin 6-kinase
MQLTPNFVSNMKDLYGEESREWLANLPIMINNIAELWNFTFLHPMPHLSYNFVGLVQLDRGQTAILKMSPGKNLTREMHWLNCIEDGVPKIYAFDESLNAYLIEHLQPGYSLKQVVKEGKDDEATRIICRTHLKLQSQHCQLKNFRHLSELAESFTALEGKFDTRLLSKAQILYHDLSNDRTNDVVLHGDLHHDNIIADKSDWKAIDPHGYVGDPAAEVGAMIRNALDDIPESSPIANRVHRRLQILADELPYNPQKIANWAFCLTALSGAWSMEDHGSVPNVVTEVLKAIESAKI